AHSGGRLDMKIPNVKRSPVAIAAMACAVISILLAWGRSRRALQASFGVALLGIGLMVVLYVTTLGELERGSKDMLKMKPGGEQSGGLDLTPTRERDAKAEVGSRWGFWVTSVAFIGVAV